MNKLKTVYNINEIIDYEKLSQDLLEYLLDLKDTHGLIELLVNMGYNSDVLIELGFDS